MGDTTQNTDNGLYKSDAIEGKQTPSLGRRDRKLFQSLPTQSIHHRDIEGNEGEPPDIFPEHT